MMSYHIPALLSESVDGLNISPSGVYVDLTYGGGGHSQKILEKLNKGVLIAFDQDEHAERNTPDDKNFIFLNQNFRFLKANLRMAGYNKVDGLLADLGVSFHQFDEVERGFSFRLASNLDMRMNPSSKTKASDIINSYDHDNLVRIFRDYGEIKRPLRMVNLIKAERRKCPIYDSETLIKLIKKYAPVGKENKFYAKVFQALRIEVNRELEFLIKMLMQAKDVLKKGGRISLITYHSLEDRIVKNFLKTGDCDGIENKDFYGNKQSPFKIINRKVIVPSQNELRQNNRARSAKLRIAEKI